MSGTLSPALDAALERLAKLHPKKIDLSLGRMERVLAALEHPERRLPPLIHVAGTNGKGSVVAYLRAMLEACGLRVHVYTSPHLVSFRERIRLAGSLISDKHLIGILNRVEKAAGDEPLTFFEATTAAAFLAFAETPADALILEVGLGGRLDATNVVDQPVSTVVTRVDVDHQEFLGRSVQDIAAEKAGIAKKGVPFITLQDEKAVLNILADKARLAGGVPILGGEHWKASISGAELHYEDARGKLDLPLPKLSGLHQAENAALAIATLRHQKTWPVPKSALRAGLGWASWPARLQRLIKGPLPQQLPNGAVLWLDGGHNPSAGRALAKTFKAQTDPERPFYLILGMLENKDVEGFLKPFKGFATAVYGIPIEGETCHSPAHIATTASSLGITGRPANHFDAALKAIAAQGDRPPPVVLIAGSLYLAGHVLQANGWTPS